MLPQGCTPGVNCTSSACCVDVCALPSNADQPCDDLDPATISDRCLHGVCQGVQATCQLTGVVCTEGKVLNATNPCLPGSTCRSDSDICCVDFCALPSNADQPCDDLDPATISDRCLNGVCQGDQATCQGAGVVCSEGMALRAASLCLPGSTCRADSDVCCVPKTCRTAGVQCSTGYTQDPTKACVWGSTCNANLCCSPGTCGTASVQCPNGYRRDSAKSCTLGLNCTAQFCCTPSTCGTAAVQCASGYAQMPTKACTWQLDCSSATCCTPTQCGTATTVTCAAGYTKAAAKACSGATCSTATCCQPSTCSTANVQCRTGFAQLSTKTCAWASTCTVSNCCAPATCGTARVACSSGFTLSVAKACVWAKTCSAATCCSPATCGAATIVCPTGYTRQSTKSCIFGTSCNVATCCVRTVRTRSVAVQELRSGTKFLYRATVTIETATAQLITMAQATVKGTFSSSGWSEAGRSGVTTKTTSAATISSSLQVTKRAQLRSAVKFCVKSITIPGYVYVATTKDCSA